MYVHKILDLIRFKLLLVVLVVAVVEVAAKTTNIYLEGTVKIVILSYNKKS